MVRVRSGALTLSVEVGCCPPGELSLPLESIGLAVEFGALPLSGLLFGGRMQIFLSRLYGRLAYLSVGAVFGSESSWAGAGGGLRFGSCLLPRLVHLRLAQPLGFRVRAFPLGLLRDLVLGAQFGGRLGCFGVGDRLLGVRLATRRNFALPQLPFSREGIVAEHRPGGFLGLAGDGRAQPPTRLARGILVLSHMTVSPV